MREHDIGNLGADQGMPAPYDRVVPEPVNHRHVKPIRMRAEPLTQPWRIAVSARHRAQGVHLEGESGHMIAIRRVERNDFGFMPHRAVQQRRGPQPCDRPSLRRMHAGDDPENFHAQGAFSPDDNSHRRIGESLL